LFKYEKGILTKHLFTSILTGGLNARVGLKHWNKSSSFKPILTALRVVNARFRQLYLCSTIASLLILLPQSGDNGL
jgi:hypothetical protein